MSAPWQTKIDKKTNIKQTKITVLNEGSIVKKNSQDKLKDIRQEIIQEREIE